MVPLCRIPELAVNTVCCASEHIQSLKGLSQDLFNEYAFNDFLPRNVNVRLRRRVRRDALGTLEVVVVMAAAAAKSQRNGKTCPAPNTTVHASTSTMATVVDDQ